MDCIQDLVWHIVKDPPDCSVWCKQGCVKRRLLAHTLCQAWDGNYAGQSTTLVTVRYMYISAAISAVYQHATQLHLYNVIKFKKWLRKHVGQSLMLGTVNHKVLRSPVHLSLPYEHAVTLARLPTSGIYRLLLIGTAAAARRPPPGRLRQRPRHQAVALEARLPERLH
jgi:hypothetical protein